MIKFAKPEKDLLIAKLKRYLNDELRQDIGAFDAEFLLDFFTRELGCYYYNQALTDMHGLFEKQLETLVDTVYQLEQPVPDKKSPTKPTDA